jgi:hypothetical protein
MLESFTAKIRKEKKMKVGWIGSGLLFGILAKAGLSNVISVSFSGFFFVR